MSTTAVHCSEVAEITTWLTHSLSEWQGHLLSCPGQLKNHDNHYNNDNHDNQDNQDNDDDQNNQDNHNNHNI